jgi:hypothetical protein
MYKDPFGHEYSSYEEYFNSPDLDSDLVAFHLWRGDRIPQNDDEARWKKELDEMKAKGQTPKFYFE